MSGPTDSEEVNRHYVTLQGALRGLRACSEAKEPKRLALLGTYFADAKGALDYFNSHTSEEVQERLDIGRLEHELEILGNQEVSW